MKYRLFADIGLLNAVVLLALCVPACSSEVTVDEPSTLSSALTEEQCSFFAVNDKVTICHRTNSAKKPYTVIKTNRASCGGHSGHDGDYVAYDDPTCSGLGCFPEGAPFDGTVECCDGLAPNASGHCANIDACINNGCGPHASCQDQAPPALDGPEGRVCTCDSGFEWVVAANGCAPIDLCANVVCSATDPCHLAGACDPATGQCSNPDRVCDDGNVCTDDSCDPTTGCVATANSAACDDGNACTQVDTCALGSCVGASPAPAGSACESGDPCRDATCGYAFDENWNVIGGNGVCETYDPCDDGLSLGETDGYDAGLADASSGCQRNPEIQCCDGDGCTQPGSCDDICPGDIAFAKAYQDGFLRGYNEAYNNAGEGAPVCQRCCPAGLTGPLCLDECAPGTFDNATGAVLEVLIDGRIVSASVPPIAFVDGDGVPVAGAGCNVRMVAHSDGFAGALEDTDGNEFEPMALASFVFTRVSDNTPVFVAPGKTVTIELPVPEGNNGHAEVGDTVEFYYYDEASETWLHETQGVVVVAADGSLSTRAAVSHFTWYGVGFPTTSATRSCVKVTVLNHLGAGLQGVLLRATSGSAWYQPAAGTAANGGLCLQTRALASNTISVQGGLPVGVATPAPVVLPPNPSATCLGSSCQTLVFVVLPNDAQEVFSISPTSGPIAGGTLVTVTGKNFGAWTEQAHIHMAGWDLACGSIQVLDSQHFTCVTSALPIVTCDAISLPMSFSVNDARYGLVNSLPNAFTYARPALFALGSGTAADPYRVQSRVELDSVRHCHDKSFLQTTDIDISGCNTFTPFPAFDGNYDGAGHAISNLCVDTPAQNGAALFVRATGNLRNFNAQNFTITGLRYVGGLVALSLGIIENVSISGTVVSVQTGSSETGGLVGWQFPSGQILGCSAAVNVTDAGGWAGALAGEVDGIVDDSTASGNVTGPFCVGGLAGLADHATITNSSATGTVTGSVNLGGLVGCAIGVTVSDSFATGSVTGSHSIGGFVGSMDGPLNLIQDSHATGDVSVNDDGGYFFGGLVGGGNFWGERGCAFGRIERSYATGNVYGWYYFVGGLVGLSCLDIEDSFALGDVRGGMPTGGLVGAQLGPDTPAFGYWGWAAGKQYADHQISGSFAAGKVTGWIGVNPYAGFPGGTGGLVGANWSIIADSYAVGEVHGTIYHEDSSGGGVIGGLVGVNLATIQRSYAAAPIVETPLTTDDVNALVGLNELNVGASLVTGVVQDSFYYDDGVPPDALAVGLTAAQMANPASFVGFDFTSPRWVMPSAHPLAPVTSPALAWECSKIGVCQ